MLVTVPIGMPATVMGWPARSDAACANSAV
ncbi:Uncharacterised protein [Mycobacteroides abscessus subsp. abscessus]|nr:Uncharacterised protein [Mycobacteroides abscessus subsp. abscessus]SKW45178.1 Uncharacterised protein [Mycobacteroides abscessus subsp. abscessus]